MTAGTVLTEGAILAAIDTLRTTFPELSQVRLVNPWALPAIVAAADGVCVGKRMHRSAWDAARAAREATRSLRPLSRSNEALAGLVALLVANFAGEECTLAEALASTE
nr:hypothetical protein [Corynebacterium lactis]